MALADQHKALADRHLSNPFFILNDGIARGTTQIDGKEYINYANYNYLGLSGEKAVSLAATNAIHTYGTSVSASRVASGERPVQRDLENALASACDTEDCIVFVSGHATNVTAIGHLFGPKDLISMPSVLSRATSTPSKEVPLINPIQVSIFATFTMSPSCA